MSTCIHRPDPVMYARQHGHACVHDVEHSFSSAQLSSMLFRQARLT